MKFTLGELKFMEPSLIELSKKDLPIKESWKIAKFLKSVNDELKGVEQERVKLIRKYGEENGGGIKVKDDQVVNFSKEYSDLLKEEVEIQILPIVIGDLGNISISSNSLANLSRIIVDEDSPK